VTTFPTARHEGTLGRLPPQFSSRHLFPHPSRLRRWIALGVHALDPAIPLEPTATPAAFAHADQPRLTSQSQITVPTCLPKRWRREVPIASTETLSPLGDYRNA